jgi:hypothetical protein
MVPWPRVTMMASIDRIRVLHPFHERRSRCTTRNRSLGPHAPAPSLERPEEAVPWDRPPDPAHFFVLRSPYDKDRAGCVAYHSLGDTPDEQMRQAGAAVGAHHNQIDLAFLGNATDRGSGMPPHHEGLHEHGLGCGQHLQTLLCLGADLVLQLCSHGQRDVAKGKMGAAEDMEQEDLGLFVYGECEPLVTRVLCGGGKVRGKKHGMYLHRCPLPRLPRMVAIMCHVTLPLDERNAATQRSALTIRLTHCDSLCQVLGLCADDQDLGDGSCDGHLSGMTG